METKRDANLASQARYEMGAQVGCSLARNVVANEREWEATDQIRRKHYERR